MKRPVAGKIQLLAVFSLATYLLYKKMRTSATLFSNSYLDLALYLVMGGYYSSKTDFIKQQIKWFDDFHNPVITDNYGNISASTCWDIDMIDDAYESGEIEFPIQARMMQEEVLSTSGYAAKDLRLLNLLIRWDKGEFGQIHPIIIFYQYNKVYEHLN